MSASAGSVPIGLVFLLSLIFANTPIILQDLQREQVSSGKRESFREEHKEMKQAAGIFNGNFQSVTKTKPFCKERNLMNQSERMQSAQAY